MPSYRPRVDLGRACNRTFWYVQLTIQHTPRQSGSFVERHTLNWTWAAIKDNHVSIREVEACIGELEMFVATLRRTRRCRKQRRRHVCDAMRRGEGWRPRGHGQRREGKTFACWLQPVLLNATTPVFHSQRAHATGVGTHATTAQLGMAHPNGDHTKHHPTLTIDNDHQTTIAQRNAFSDKR